MIDAIRYRWEFQLLRNGGRYRRSGPLGVRSALDGDLTNPRVAYAISTSVGPAVVRNRIRRRLRALFRELNAAGAVQPGRYLVIVSPQASSSSFDDLRTHLSQAIGSE